MTTWRGAPRPPPPDPACRSRPRPHGGPVPTGPRAPQPATPPWRPRPQEAPPPGRFRSTDRSLRGPGGWLWGAWVLCRRRCAGRGAGVGVGGPRRPSGVRPAGRSSQAAMAEAAPQHLTLPSGLLESCALLGPSRDSLRGPEQEMTWFQLLLG
ncbi:translation initiation factor IF-2-like isoform X1 [Ursus arctos]|uniref:translation initiation factor IF-2-like isoform X1 n=1 Tax=Ursus arctos TaxID=9644 RepID=UPI0020180A7D|nr:translation initiation factor IF-2-like isoform X1 [Ursus arctos]